MADKDGFAYAARTKQDHSPAQLRLQHQLSDGFEVCARAKPRDPLIGARVPPPGIQALKVLRNLLI